MSSTYLHRQKIVQEGEIAKLLWGYLPRGTILDEQTNPLVRWSRTQGRERRGRLGFIKDGSPCAYRPKSRRSGFYLDKY